MRKLLLILLGFIAIFTFIRTIEEPEAAELRNPRQEANVELSITNFSEID
ncbi:MAG: hypothetical protein FWG99_12195 [Treponema sp.]|nr:hypothetical protein [Treponema sp.]